MVQMYLNSLAITRALTKYIIPSYADGNKPFSKKIVDEVFIPLLMDENEGGFKPSEYGEVFILNIKVAIKKGDIPAMLMAHFLSKWLPGIRHQPACFQLDGIPPTRDLDNPLSCGNNYINIYQRNDYEKL